MGVIPPDVIDEVHERSGWACEASTPDCIGTAQVHHHRKLRKHGGGHDAVNILHVCDSEEEALAALK